MKTKPIQSQFKANLLNAQMNVNKVLTKDYENVRLHGRWKNKANQTQSNPISPPKKTEKNTNFFPIPDNFTS